MSAAQALLGLDIQQERFLLGLFLLIPKCLDARRSLLRSGVLNPTNPVLPMRALSPPAVLHFVSWEIYSSAFPPEPIAVVS